MADLFDFKREVRIKAEISAVRSVVRRLWGQVHSQSDSRTDGESPEKKQSIFDEHVVACDQLLRQIEEQAYQELLELFEDRDPGFAARLDDRPDPADPSPGQPKL